MSARPDLLDTVDGLNHAKHLVTAALMAVADIHDERQRKALDALIVTAVNKLDEVVAGVEALRFGVKP